MTREIQLTKGVVALVDDEDYEWLNQWNWQCMDGYAIRKDTQAANRHAYCMHRVIMDAPPGMEVDHINHNPSDNRRCNLRLCTKNQNNLNRKNKVPNHYKGIGFEKRKVRNQWYARITIDKRQINLGYFASPEDAARAYDDAAKKYHGEFACLNFP